ncbi:MAG: hypothetical protein KDK99_07395 [Verrucomicrobiales bacterium]|nr:hypothetical protein [Verrucomicrobiales bacterium]
MIFRSIAFGFLSMAAACLDAADPPPGRAMWVYQTREILASVDERAALLDFCAARSISDLFWQVYFDRESTPPRLMEVEALRAFLKQAHGRGLRVHTLGGDPSHVLKENHPRVLAMVDEILAFNAEGEAFDGIHLDVEPHVLTRWQKATAEERTELITQMVELHTQVAEHIHQAAPALSYGVDLVFWLNRTDDAGRLLYPVTFRGETRDAADFLMEVTDNIGLMGYRETAEGRNGIIDLAEPLIAEADAARSRIWVGVKMADQGLPHETFFGRSEEEMMQELEKVEHRFRSHRGFAGLSFFHYGPFRQMAVPAR